MRALLQRVTEASVRVGDALVGAIGPGLVVFLGVGQGDSDADASWLADKVAGLRIFPDAAGKMNKSLVETHRAALVVSQFTLYADTHKGRRPSFTGAAAPEEANRLYQRFCADLAETGTNVERGIFAADMRVALVNDGPVTLLLETPGAPTETDASAAPQDSKAR